MKKYSCILKNKTESAFTLVELAIVLVIIGLVAGGVLAGTDLIEQAKIRSQITQINNYSLAAKVFESKYNCLPGDCIDATAHNLGQPGGPGENGDGDGYITSKCFTAPYYWVTYNGAEALNFWYHLSAAELLPVGLTSGYTASIGSLVYNTAASFVFPEAKLNPKASIIPTDFNCGPEMDSRLRVAGNGYVLGIVVPGNNPGQVGISPGLTYLQAYSIDAKIDDGKPLTGNVGKSEYWRYEYANISNMDAVGEPCATSGNDYILNSANISFNGYTGPATCTLAITNQY